MVHCHMPKNPETIAISSSRPPALPSWSGWAPTGRPVLVTRFGQPIAEVVPPPPLARPERWLGSMRHRGRIVGDIVASAAEGRHWDALRP